MERATGETFIEIIYSISFIIFCGIIFFRNITVQYPEIFGPAALIAIIGLIQSTLFITLKST
jgi:hypothetical protein